MDVVFCFNPVTLFMPVAGVALLISSWLIRDTINRYADSMPGLREHATVLLRMSRAIALSAVAVLVLWFVISFVEPFVAPPQC